MSVSWVLQLLETTFHIMQNQKILSPLLWLLFLISSCFVAASQVPGSCAEIRTSYLAWKENGSPDGRFSGIPGQVAYDCLRSMPFRSDLAVKFVDEYTRYLQFHSTLEILKNPPDGYISTSVDLVKGFEKIRDKAVGNIYSSQYDFDNDMKYLVSRANDGHLGLELCSHSIMHFEHGVPLVSISEDGRQLPQIYTYFDAELKVRGAVDISPVVRINGEDPTYHLQASIGVSISLQDPDARYNSLFPSHAAGFAGRYGGGYWTNHLGLWSGPSHTLEFSNGTKQKIETTASLSMNGFENIVDGDTLFQVACLPGFGNSSVTTPHAFSPYSLPSSGPSSFPPPIVRHRNHFMQGYYLNEGEYQHTAVLQVPTFKLDGEIPRTFSQTANKFVNQALADGKNRMIIDLSGNGGGDINIGLDIFRIFFPHENIDTRTRFRATELIFLMGKIFSSEHAREHYGNFPLDLPLVAHLAVTPDQNKTFGSWEELYGPKDIEGASMSELYATFNFTSASTEEDPIQGFGNITSTHTSQPFSADNIIIMTDGYCASTCVLLARLLQGKGVRSIVFGGRPRHAPMQLLGGVRGGQYWSLKTISRYVREAYEVAVNASQLGSPILSAEELARYREISPSSTEDFSLRFDTLGSSGVNFRNEYSKQDGFTPLQFVHESANCRLFFTAENYIRPATMWLMAARTMFGNESCAPDFTNKVG